jgi:hypothetical protein
MSKEEKERIGEADRHRWLIQKKQEKGVDQKCPENIALGHVIRCKIIVIIINHFISFLLFYLILIYYNNRIQKSGNKWR